jgi:SAM-dependent MidA family methyltransferase
VDPAERLRSRLRRVGAMPFAAFMEEALYGEGGYYTGARSPIGPQGDFVTGASLSPLFGRATARLLRRLDAALGRPADLLEGGCGSGTHLGAVAAALGAGGGRRLLGWDRVRPTLAPGVERLERLSDLGSGTLQGLVFSYELFDAQPVHRLVGRSSAPIGELWVELDARGEFAWREGELSEPRLADMLPAPHGHLEPGQIADLAPGWAPLYRDLARVLGSGLLVTCDYGFEIHRLLDPRVRFHGTLACYRRHRVHRDPLRDVGRQDITAHVDFSLLRRVGEEEGLETVALTRQAAWLAACGVFEDLGGGEGDQRPEVLRLLDGEGMGEEIRVLVQARGAAAASCGRSLLASLGG